MHMQAPAVVVTGASGYLGSRICQTLEAMGRQPIRLARSPGQRHGQVLSYDLAMPITAQVKEALRSADALIHAAYDLSLTRSVDIWRVNVEGTYRLLKAAKEAAVNRIIVLSSMSAFEGTSQLYGRAKLDIEAMTVEFGGCAVRPGLVYSEQAGGMAGAMRKLIALPIIPVITGGASVYTVREEDLMRVITLLAAATTLEPGTISVAHPSRVTLIDLLRAFAAEENRRCRFVPVPWQLIYWLLRSGELIRLQLPFRADSLLGLTRTAPSLVGSDQLARLGVNLHGFGTAMAGSKLPSGRHLCASSCSPNSFHQRSVARSATFSTSQTPSPSGDTRLRWLRSVYLMSRIRKLFHQGFGCTGLPRLPCAFLVSIQPAAAIIHRCRILWVSASWHASLSRNDQMLCTHITGSSTAFLRCAVPGRQDHGLDSC
jgi:nucleoside-diphosphate-sugar epimerase